jgi:ATP-binding cassette, subfamily B, bacterial MsbA
MKSKTGISAYKWVLKHVLRYKYALIIGCLGMIGTSSIDAFLISKLKPIINNFNNSSLILIKWLPVFVIVIFLLRSIAGFAGNYSLMRVSRNIVRDFRVQLFNHYCYLPAKYYDNNSTGTMLAVILYNVDQLSNGVSSIVIIAMRDIAYVSALLVVMFYMSWHMSILFLVIAPIIAYAVSLSSKRQRKVSHNVQESVADLTRLTEQGLQSYRVVRMFSGQDSECTGFANTANSTRNQELKLVVTNSLNTGLVQILMSLPIAAAVFFATNPANAITSGAFTAFVVSILSLTRPVRRLTTINSQVQSSIAAAESIIQALAEPLEHDRSEIEFTDCKGNVSFEDVSFQYADDSKSVLQNISFTAEPGSVVALVGYSGSGKSTLVSLLPRFYDLKKGVIKIDGRDISTFTLKSLRKQISYVTQQVDLFDTSVRGNIAYGETSDATDAEVEQALKAANAWEFVSQMPEGIHTEIGERGLRLSGGQRQRLSIARALLKKSPILILDEATASLDTVSEAEIQKALPSLMQNRTTIVIAHRLSTISNADKIIVMDKGAIVESGTHDELIKDGGCYAELYKMQFSSQKKH